MATIFMSLLTGISSTNDYRAGRHDQNVPLHVTPFCGPSRRQAGARTCCLTRLFLQDSPGAKMSYDACVRVPAPLTALMSAVPMEDAPSGKNVSGCNRYQREKQEVGRVPSRQAWHKHVVEDHEERLRSFFFYVDTLARVLRSNEAVNATYVTLTECMAISYYPWGTILFSLALFSNAPYCQHHAGRCLVSL